MKAGCFVGDTCWRKNYPVNQNDAMQEAFLSFNVVYGQGFYCRVDFYSSDLYQRNVTCLKTTFLTEFNSF